MKVKCKNYIGGNLKLRVKKKKTEKVEKKGRKGIKSQWDKVTKIREGLIPRIMWPDLMDVYKCIKHMFD